MKLRSSILGGICAAMLSQGASAWIPGIDTPDLTLLLSGATASENGIKSLLQGGLCLQDGNVDAFEGTNQKVVFCTMDNSVASVPGLSGTLKVLVRKSGVGGSGNGVRPVCDAVPLTNGFMVVTTGAGGACTETTPGNWTCTGFTTETLTPQAGISDVGPTETFAGTASTGCGANVFGSFETIFAIPVTKRLRDAFQEAQGLTVNSDLAVDMPSMSSSMYASILAGRVARWSDLRTDVGANLTAVSNPPADTRVTHCRRTDTSGTYAANQIRIMQRSCVAGAASIAAPNAFPADVNGPVITAQLSGSGNVEDCLVAMNDNGVYNTRAGSNWAIGMLSTDRNPVAAGKNWRFMRMNGVVPTFENVANGSYKHSVTSTIQWKNLTGDSLLIAQKIQTDSATPVEIGNVRFNHPWGASGLLALAENGFAVTYTGTGTPLDPFVYDDTKPVTPFTHKTASLSNCIDPLRVPGKAVPIE